MKSTADQHAATVGAPLHTVHRRPVPLLTDGQRALLTPDLLDVIEYRKSGLFYRDEIRVYYQENGLPEPYDETARRKVFPETLEHRILTARRGQTPSPAPTWPSRHRLPAHSGGDRVTTSIPTALEGKRLAVVDVEGNGQNPPEIVEIAVLPVDGAHTRGEDMRTWLIRPETPISSFVTRKVHGINNEDVANCPPWTTVAGDVQALLTDHVLVAHSATVEHRVLTSHLPTWKPAIVLDTLRLAKHVWPGLDGYGLDVLIKYADLDTGGTNEQRRHRAGYDAWCAWRLLLVLADHSDLDWNGLVKVAALPGFVPPDEDEGGLW